MRSVFQPDIDPAAFLRHGVIHGYGMQEGLIDPKFCADVSDELEEAGYLRDYMEQIPTLYFREKDMRATALLHECFNGVLAGLNGGVVQDYLQLFSVRVFPVGEPATTIHRNHSSVKPWAIGITLKGEAPFNVYPQSILPIPGMTVGLKGDDTDPTPLASMPARAGAAWVLYTENESMPHAGGLVSGDVPTDDRELLILFNQSYR